MNYLTADSLTGMAHGMTDSIDCIPGDETFKTRDFTARQFMRKPVMGQHERKYPVPFYAKFRIRYSLF
jgi:hypothetical protein